MANTHTTLNDLFTGIADAIRAKNGSTEVIVADNFPTEIENLRTGFDYNNQSVTAIPDYGFYGCEDLNSVDCCNLTSVGESAFEGCENLKRVVLYEGVESVGENAFNGCNEDLVICCAISSKPDTWHENWNPDNRLVIWGETNVILIDTFNVSSTEEDDVSTMIFATNDNEYILIFNGNGKMKNFHQSYPYLAPWSSYKANIISITIPDGVTSIGSSAFSGCTGLTSITIPDSVTSIGNHAFNGCEGLTSITIPDSVISIGSSAFENTPWLETKKSENPFVIVNSILIDGKSCSGKVVIPDSVTSIGGYAFGQCTYITSITIPDGVTSIGSSAFQRCTGLTSIPIPNSVTSIGSGAFYVCTGLTSIVYAGTVAQWDTITKGTNWNSNTGNYTIHCTDGDIAKDGTITYHTTE